SILGVGAHRLFLSQLGIERHRKNSCPWYCDNVAAAVECPANKIYLAAFPSRKTEGQMAKRKTAAVAAKQRGIQRQVARADARRGAGGKKKQEAMQAGARRYPVPPFPRQHQPKP